VHKICLATTAIDIQLYFIYIKIIFFRDWYMVVKYKSCALTVMGKTRSENAVHPVHIVH
jgi:hypothetical protein